MGYSADPQAGPGCPHTCAQERQWLVQEDARALDGCGKARIDNATFICP